MASSAILKGKTASSFHGNPCVPSGDDLCYTLEPGFGAQVEHEDISRSSRAVQSIPKMNGRSLSDVWQMFGAESLGFQGVWRAHIWREKQKRLGREEKVVTSASIVGCHF